MKKKCPKCGKMFVLGKEGLLDPLGCDKCLGVERIADVAWLPGEEYHYDYDAQADKIIQVTREQARAI
jgi:endogenous inhibitor of DNA gyrase (YacG/DUF329 family)